MKNFIAIVTFLLVMLGAWGLNNAKPDDKQILWTKDSLLTWDDFQGKAPATAATAAMTYTTIGLNSFDYTSTSYNVSIKAMFVKNKSWVQIKKATDYLLKHEQLHFDIAELFARKLRKGLTEGKFTSSQLSNQVTAMFKDYNSKLEAYQAKYDKETNHSRITEKQEQWESAVPKELLKLDAYTDTLVVITIK
jgi:hypothetical protein